MSQESHAIAGRTARCRCKFKYVWNFTTASCIFPAIARLSCRSLSADCNESSVNKKAELSQRRPRDAPNIWVPWKISRVPTTPTATFPEICNGLLFRSILRMCVQNFEVRSFTRSWDNTDTEKISAVSEYAQAHFFPKFLMSFCSDGPCECTCQIWSS